MTVLQVLAGILAALMLCAAAAGSGRVTAQAAPSLADASIAARVARALKNERSLEHAHIGVDTLGGMVTLSGFAGTIEDIAIAGRLAGGIDGVRAVTNEIVVVGMRQNPFPKKARKLLDEAGLAYRYLEYGSYLGQWRRRLALKMWTGWPTIPMVFVKGVLIGGASDLARLIESGELARKR